MEDKPHHWIIIGALIALASLFMDYRKEGTEEGRIWVAGGPGFSQSSGSGYMNGTVWGRAKKGTETNYHGFLFFPLAGALAWMFSDDQAAPGRRRFVSWLAVICIAIGVFITKDGNFSGNGFLLGLVGLGASIYGLRLSKPPKAKPAPPPIPS